MAQPTISKMETIQITMAQQKLYTEEQVIKVWKAGQKYWETSGASITLEELLEHEKPIELPSDEEILALIGDGMHDYYKGGFEEGAKWMRDKILNK